MMKVTEKFYSIQGEGRRTGHPSVFLRTFGCNFQCRGFNMEPGEKTTQPEELIEANIQTAKSIHDFPVSTEGCDSYISWHPKLKSYSPDIPVKDLVDHLLALTPNNSFKGIDLVITGGEPLIKKWQKEYIELLEILFNRYGLQWVTFETNGTQELTSDFMVLLQNYWSMFHFSVSPKLPCSGEPFEKAIKKEVVREYFRNSGAVDLKFVIENEYDYDNLVMALNEYRNSYDNVFLMPQGADKENYQKNARNVADIALKYGLCYSPRLHVDLFGNEWNT